MPIGNWQEENYQLPSALPLILNVGVNTSSATKSAKNALLGAGAESLHATEARSAPLLRLLSDARRSQTSNGSVISCRLLETQSLGGSTYLHDRYNVHKTNQAMATDSNYSLLCRSAHAVKTWTNFGKVEAVPETLCMYPVPSTVSTATGSSSRRTFSSNESAFSRTVMEEEPCYCSKKPTHKVLEMDPDDKNEDELKNLSMAEAAEILAESNLASHSAHEVAAKFSQAKQDGSTTFSKRFLKSCHLYGEMGDQVQSVMKKINKLQKGDTVTSEEIQDRKSVV